MGVVEKKYIKPFVSKKLYKTLPSTCFVVFEYKNPYVRIPNGKIPHGYMIQVQTGLNDLKKSDIGIYIDMAVRCCSLNDLDWTDNYNRTQFPKDCINFGEPLAIGFIGIAGPELHHLHGAEDAELEHDFEYNQEQEYHNDPFERTEDEDDCIDFGNTSEKNLIIMMEKVYKGKYVPFYTPPTPKEFNYFKWFKKFLDFCEEKGLHQIGIMPYKVFRAPIVSLEKDTDFIKPKHVEEIKDFFGFVKEHKHKSDQEKIKAVRQRFDKKIRTENYAKNVLHELEKIL